MEEKVKLRLVRCLTLLDLEEKPGAEKCCRLMPRLRDSDSIFLRMGSSFVSARYHLKTA